MDHNFYYFLFAVIALMGIYFIIRHISIFGYMLIAVACVAVVMLYNEPENVYAAAMKTKLGEPMNQAVKNFCRAFADLETAQ